MKAGLLLFFIQILLNFVGTVNMIATAQRNYFWTIVSDIAIAFLGYVAISQIAAKANRVAKLIGFSLGAVVGSVIGIWLSKIILTQ